MGERVKDLILETLENREALLLAIDTSLVKHFNFFPHEYIPRLRRNEVHHTIIRELGFSNFGDARFKRIIKECLAARGVRFTICGGRRMFVGLDYKHGKPKQDRLHSRKHRSNQQDT